jgi:hypothetical protein
MLLLSVLLWPQGIETIFTLLTRPILAVGFH